METNLMHYTDDQLAEILWNYHRLGQEPQKSDIIFGLGSHDIRTAERAAELWLQGFAPIIVFSGNEGVGRDISGFAGIPEAVHFKNRAVHLGVPEEVIIVESRATNTGENIRFTHELLLAKQITHKSIIAVQKPYMERRTFATIMKQWPEVPKPVLGVTSIQISYEEFVADPRYPKDYTINVMVGDTQRIVEYAKQGYQIVQDIPYSVQAAYAELVRRGYNQHLLGMY